LNQPLNENLRAVCGANHAYFVRRCRYKPLTDSVVAVSIVIISRWFDDSRRCRQL